MASDKQLSVQQAGSRPDLNCMDQKQNIELLWNRVSCSSPFNGLRQYQQSGVVTLLSWQYGNTAEIVTIIRALNESFSA